MAGSVGPPGVSRSFTRCLGILLATGCLAAEGFAQIQGSAGQEGTKPFTATVAIREGYDSNPLTQSYQLAQDIDSSTYTSIQPSLGYNYIGLQADAALRWAATKVVLHAVTFEDTGRSVVHADREVHGELSAWLAQDGGDTRIKAEPLCGKVKLLLRDCPGAIL